MATRQSKRHRLLALKEHENSMPARREEAEGVVVAGSVLASRYTRLKLSGDGEPETCRRSL